MKLVNSDYGLNLEFHENEVQVLTAENPTVYAALVQEMYRQCEGGEGSWFLYASEKERSLAKYAELVLSPLTLDVNNRKILGKLYQELQEISQEDFYVQTQQINSEVVQYLDQLSMKLPYPICFQTELDVSGVYKLYDLRLETETEGILQRVNDYIRILQSLCGISLVIFVNLKSYLQDFELLELYKTAFYSKMNMLLLEPVQRKMLDGEYNVVIDQQKCVIEF